MATFSWTPEIPLPTVSGVAASQIEPGKFFETVDAKKRGSMIPGGIGGEDHKAVAANRGYHLQKPGPDP